MRRVALFAVLQCFGMMALSQSIAKAPGTLPASSDKLSAPQPLFNFDSSQFGQIFQSAKSRNMDSCLSLNANQRRVSAQGDLNQPFHVPCLNLNYPMVALNYVPASPSLTQPWPKAKLEPIPTQWLNAKVEPIPTTWPNLKMLPIAGHNLGSVSAK